MSKPMILKVPIKTVPFQVPTATIIKHLGNIDNMIDAASYLRELLPNFTESEIHRNLNYARIHCETALHELAKRMRDCADGIDHAIETHVPTVGDS